MHQPHFSFLNQLSSHRPYWSLKFSIFAAPFSNSESHCSFHKKILIPVNIVKDLHCFWCATVVSAVTRYEQLVHWHLNTARLLAALTLKQLLPQLHYFPLPIHYPHLRNQWPTCITNFNGTATAFTFFSTQTGLNPELTRFKVNLLAGLISIQSYSLKLPRSIFLWCFLIKKAIYKMINDWDNDISFKR